MLSRRSFLAAGATLPAASTFAADAVGAVALRCDYLKDPLGLDVTAPRFSWQLTAGMQSAYQIVVESGGATVWDSGKVTAAQSVHVPYAGAELRSRQRCSWQVRVWNEAGVASVWSEAAWFEMALLRASDWRAKWVGAAEAESESGVNTEPSPWFRREFQLASVPKTARAYVCGLGFFELYLNGRKVSEDVLAPAQTDYDRRRIRRVLYPFDDRTAKRVNYLTYDVTAYLRAGANAAGVVLGDGWYNQRDRVEEGWLWYGSPRMIAQLEGDDGAPLVASDESWRVTTAGPILHSGLFTGEQYDARLEMPGWNAAGFDDSAWAPAAVVRAPTGVLCAQVAPPDRVMEVIQGQAVQAAPGVLTLDAGRNLAGWAKLSTSGPRGRKVTLRFREDSGRDYGQRDTYVLKGAGVETWEPRFTWHGFRYVDVTGAAEAPQLEVRSVHSAVEAAGRFECSNPLFNKIHETFVKTQLANMHGGVTSDCPHRERLGYTGDGQVAAQAAIYALDMARFYTKWTDDIADSRNHQTGFVPHTAPFEGGGGGPPWGSAMVLMPWYLYLYYGDRMVLARHYEAMRAWVRYLESRMDAQGIVVKEEPGGWFLGDWCPPQKIAIPPEFVSTCYYAHCADLLGRAAMVLGRQEEAATLAGLVQRTSGALQARYYDAGKRQYVDGRQGANFFPLAFGLVPREVEGAVFARAVEIVERDNREHFDTGFVGTPLVLDVLTAWGRADLAYRLMNQRDLPGFGHMLASGATTLWENWDGGGSRMHPMFGGACRWFWQGLAGITPDERRPGFERVLIQPRPVEDLQWVKADYRTLRGTIAVNWTRASGRFRMSLTVPANTEALVTLPGGTEQQRVGPGVHQLGD
ncbi:family 78 glycoside hydrolase catalytic domain [Paludibaculum fermentans]|uniref:family 78 glycoside hydrolase catalytic domain n=1 Tax=Paludibaculum fermentans TaxID=1473598 RepID=UPI003EC121F7